MKYIMKAAMPGITRGMKAAVQAWHTEQDAFERAALGPKADQLSFGDFDKGGGQAPAIPGKVGRVVRMSSRALQAMDSFFKTAIGQMEVSAQAYRIAKAQGLTGEALEDSIKSQVQNPGSMAWQRAVTKAQELTFQTKLRNKAEGGHFAERSARTIQDWKSQEHLVGLIFPFIRTPFNIFATGLSKTPLGSIPAAARVINGLYQMKNGKPFMDSYSKAQQVKDITTQTIAWATALLLMGSIEGDKDDDDKNLLITGSRPYGVDGNGSRELANRTKGGPYQIRIGGRNGININYGRYEPIATVLSTVADAIRVGKTEGDMASKLGRFGEYFLAQAQDKTFLQGFAAISQALQTAGNQSQGDTSKVVTGVTKQLLAALVPNLIRQPLRNLDDYVRDSRNADAIYSLLPAGGNAPKKADVYGNDQEKGGNPLSRLLFAGGMKPTPSVKMGDQFLLNWNRENPDKPFYPTAPNDHKYKDATGQKVDMTSDQIAAYDKAVGHRFAQGLPGWLTPQMAAHPTEEHRRQFESEHSKAAREVKAEMFGGGAAPVVKRSNDISTMFGWK